MAFISPLAMRSVRLSKAYLLAQFVFAAWWYVDWIFKSSSSQVPLTEFLSWVPSLGVNLEFSFDRLSSVFSGLVIGLGLFIQLYASLYFKSLSEMRRYLFPMMLFFASMLGVVFSDNLVLLFLFWELTSLSSFFLIGFDRENPQARKSAWTALLTTGLGGLSLLAGIIILGEGFGTYRISELVGRASMLNASVLANAAGFVLLGVLTKSAQFPFQYWLPGAMSAPAPVSAYLHSATLVKMGVYLVARLNPVFLKTPLWSQTLVALGISTFFLGSLWAYLQSPLKKILAYTTVSALGLMMFLLGLNSETSLNAFYVFLVAHALYKAPLFMSAGILEKATHLKDIRDYGGVYARLRVLFFAVLIAAVSLLGFGPVLGFVSKELILELGLGSQITLWPFVLFCVGAVLSGAVALRWIYEIFFFKNAKKVPEFSVESEKLFKLSLLPLALGFVSVYFSISTELLGKWIGVANLHLWHGFNGALAMSVVMVLLAAVLFFARFKFREWSSEDKPIIKGEFVFNGILEKVLSLGLRVNRVIQSGQLPRYVSVVAWVWIVGLAFYLVQQGIPTGLGAAFANINLFEIILFGCVAGAVVYLLRVKSSLAALVVLGVVGYLVAVIFGMLGAPDLALTQLSIESLALLIFVLLLPQMPSIKEFQNSFSKTLRILLSGAMGILMAGLGLWVFSNPTESLLSSYFRNNSLLEANGRNVVNVIIVDFRGIDTMGEITVLVIAALGVSSLIYFRKKGIASK
jgi:multicomponent Na+:H+ antiporter subunit A